MGLNGRHFFDIGCQAYYYFEKIGINISEISLLSLGNKLRARVWIQVTTSDSVMFSWKFTITLGLAKNFYHLCYSPYEMTRHNGKCPDA